MRSDSGTSLKDDACERQHTAGVEIDRRAWTLHEQPEKPQQARSARRDRRVTRGQIAEDDPPLRVKYVEVTNDGSLRFPIFQGEIY